MAKTILHIAEAPGGVERYLITLLTKMKQYSEYEHVLLCSEAFELKKFDGLIKEAVVIKEMHNAISCIKDFESIVCVRRFIKKYRPDIIYCHSSKAGAIGRIADIGIKNKLVYNAHGWSFNIRSIGWKKIKIYEIIERILALITDKIICISEYEKKSALEHKICTEKKIVVINNGIDFDEYEKISPKRRDEFDIPNDAFVVGTIGRLCNQKATDIFIKMAADIKKRINNAFFVIVGDDIGDGSYRKNVESQIEHYGLEDSFVITGWVDDPLDYADIFDAATLLSRWEGFGLVLAEYMLMKKPIVGTRVDAIPYVVGNAGLMVNVDDYKSAAESVIRLHDNNELRSQLIENGRERIKMFDAQRTAVEHYQLFSKLESHEYLPRYDQKSLTVTTVNS